MRNIDKVQITIEYIESHLTKKLDLDEIARAVHYSKYYLHRLFSKTVGLTIHEYLQRRQLTEAAKLLIFSDKSILDIALLSGYKSQQSFTSMFKNLYKKTPNKYRENERFYPLQLKFKFEDNYNMIYAIEDFYWDITYACEYDIPCWMDLVRLVIDGFPYLNETEHIQTLKQEIKKKQALILKDGNIAVGIMLFSYKTGSINFMGTHPLYKKSGIPQVFINKVINELLSWNEISITTYRKNDKADIGHRKEIMELGFAEAELLVEFGYPTQRFVLPRRINNE